MSKKKFEEKKVEEKKVEEKKPPYFVTKGKALISMKGIIADGAEIKPEWVHGGKDTLEALHKKGLVGKN